MIFFRPPQHLLAMRAVLMNLPPSESRRISRSFVRHLRRLVPSRSSASQRVVAPLPLLPPFSSFRPRSCQVVFLDASETDLLRSHLFTVREFPTLGSRRSSFFFSPLPLRVIERSLGAQVCISAFCDSPDFAFVPSLPWRTRSSLSPLLRGRTVS